jgi:hypothetical protein
MTTNWPWRKASMASSMRAKGDGEGIQGTGAARGEGDYSRRSRSTAAGAGPLAARPNGTTAAGTSKTGALRRRIELTAA